MRSSRRDVAVSKPLLALARADDHVGRVIGDALATVGLTPSKFNVLMELAASTGGRLPLCEIGRRLIRSAPNITGLVDRLEADGFVRREPDPDDRRRVMAAITEVGWGTLRRAAPLVFEAERRLLHEVGAEDRRMLIRVLETVANDAAES